MAGKCFREYRFGKLRNYIKDRIWSALWIYFANDVMHAAPSRCFNISNITDLNTEKLAKCTLLSKWYIMYGNREIRRRVAAIVQFHTSCTQFSLSYKQHKTYEQVNICSFSYCLVWNYFNYIFWLCYLKPRGISFILWNLTLVHYLSLRV